MKRMALRVCCYATAAAWLGTALLSSPAWAQADYPAKPIRMVILFAKHVILPSAALSMAALRWPGPR